MDYKMFYHVINVQCWVVGNERMYCDTDGAKCMHAMISIALRVIETTYLLSTSFYKSKNLIFASFKTDFQLKGQLR